MSLDTIKTPLKTRERTSTFSRSQLVSCFSRDFFAFWMFLNTNWSYMQISELETLAQLRFMSPGSSDGEFKAQGHRSTQTALWRPLLAELVQSDASLLPNTC